MKHEKSLLARKGARSTSGKILLELILVAPLLLAIPGYVVEITRFIQRDQIASVFSQEVALAAYRQCGDFNSYTEDFTSPPTSSAYGKFKFDSTRSKARTQACLDGIANTFRARITALLPGSNLVVSVYRYNFGGTTTNTATQVAISPIQSTANDDYTKTRFVIGDNNSIKRSSSAKDQNTLVKLGSTGSNYVSGVSTRERLVVAEVTFQYIPIIRFIPGLSLVTNGAFRETTVL